MKEKIDLNTPADIAHHQEVSPPLQETHDQQRQLAIRPNSLAGAVAKAMGARRALDTHHNRY